MPISVHPDCCVRVMARSLLPPGVDMYDRVRVRIRVRVRVRPGYGQYGGSD